MSGFLTVLVLLALVAITPLLFCVLVILFYMIFSISGKLSELENFNRSEIEGLTKTIADLIARVESLKKIIETMHHPDKTYEDDVVVELEPSQLEDIEKQTSQATVETVVEEIISEEKHVKEEFSEIKKELTQEVVEEVPKTAKEKEGFLFKDNLEAYIGGRLLNRIGALALIIGIAFFLKYAFDQNWISETTRVLIGALLGGGLLFGGWISFKKEFTVFSQGLVGAGIGTLYISFYAAYNFYELVPYPVAVLLMTIVTVLALAQALYYNSLAIATLGLIGGFLTPFILPADVPSAVGLFVYLVFLNIAVIALMIKKDSWRILEISSIIITFAVYIAWAASVADRQEFFISALFLTLVWLMYYSLNLSRVVKGIKGYLVVTNISNIVLIFFYYINMLELVDYYFDNYWSIVSFALMLVCLATAILIQYQYRDQRKIMGQYIIPAILLLVIATEQEYKSYMTVILYSFEALALVALGISWKRNYIWVISYFVFSLALLKLTYLFFANPVEICEFVAIFNEQAAAFLVLIGTMGMATLILEQNVLVNYKRFALGLLRTSWIALTFIFIGVEISYYFDKLVYIANKDYISMFKYCKPIFISLVWVLYSLQLIKYGLVNKYLSYKILGTTIFVIAVSLGLIVGASFEPLEHFAPVLNIRFGLFIIIVVSLITIGRWVEKYLLFEQDKTKAFLVPFIRYSWAIVLFILFTVETNDYFNYILVDMSGKSAELIAFYKPLMLSIIWSFFALGSIQQGLARDQKGYIIIGFIMLFLSLLFSVVVGSYFHPIIYYIPIANLRFVSIGVVVVSIVLVISWLKQTGSYYPWSKQTIKALRVMASLFLILLLTYESMDLFNKELNVLSIAHSSLVNEAKDAMVVYYLNFKQLTLSVLWLLYSVILMMYGISKRIKVLRVTAICFFSIAILKIFCYDLRFLDTLYRIFSFLGLGVISLGISYLYQRYKDLILGDDK